MLIEKGVAQDQVQEKNDGEHSTLCGTKQINRDIKYWSDWSEEVSSRPYIHMQFFNTSPKSMFVVVTIRIYQSCLHDMSPTRCTGKQIQILNE